MSDATLVLRLAGPLQSWGGASKFKVRGTLDFPTYSGLVGLFSAAFGFGRSDVRSREFFDRLSLVVRVDRPGVKVRDFQTVGETDAGRWRVSVGGRRGRGSATRIMQVPVGNGKPWTFPTDVTYRYYLSDASFTVFVSGDADDVNLLAAALRAPKWQLSLGRKTCVPDFPLVLGVWSAPADELVRLVPFVDVLTVEDFEPVPVRVHWLSGGGGEWLEPVLVPDAPLGAHPQDGYGLRRRFIDRVSFSAPRVSSRDVLLDWVSGLEAGVV